MDSESEECNSNYNERMLRSSGVPHRTCNRETVVFSRHANDWVLARQVIPARKGYLTFEYEVQGNLCRKNVLPASRHIRKARMTVGEEEEDAVEVVEFDPEGIRNNAAMNPKDWDCRGWEARGDVPANTHAAGTDFIISFCSADRNEDIEILRHLSEVGAASGPWGNYRRVITFCTDRSLGMGAHFVDGQYKGRTNPRYDWLGPPGTPSPGRLRPWFKEYAKAAKEVNFGMLIINPTEDYLRSKACRHEFGGTSSKQSASAIPKNRHFMYVRSQDRIVGWKDWGVEVSEILGESQLILAAQKGYVDQIHLLLQKSGVKDIEAVDKRGMTALMHAAWYGNYEATACLIDAQAQVDARSNSNSTAVNYAIAEKHYEVTKLLLDHGAEAPLKRPHSALQGAYTDWEIGLMIEEPESVSSDDTFEDEPKKKNKKKHNARKPGRTHKRRRQF